MNNAKRLEILFFAFMVAASIGIWSDHRLHVIYDLKNQCENQVFHDYPASTISQNGNFNLYADRLDACSKDYNFWNFSH